MTYLHLKHVTTVQLILVKPKILMCAFFLEGEGGGFSDQIGSSYNSQFSTLSKRNAIQRLVIEEGTLKLAELYSWQFHSSI